MYAFLDGIVDEIQEDGMDLVVGGIGYELMVPTGLLNRAKRGDSMRVYTHLNVKEDEMTLYGFASSEEKRMFRLLLTVNKVGPRIALGILSAMTADEVQTAIYLGDEQSFSRVSGIGKRTAQQILLDLKNKVDGFSLTPAQDNSGGGSSIANIAAEAIEALLMMGFDAPSAASAVALVKAEGGTAEEMAMRALRALDRNK